MDTRRNAQSFHIKTNDVIEAMKFCAHWNIAAIKEERKKYERQMSHLIKVHCMILIVCKNYL